MSVRVLALTALAPAVWGSTYVVTTELLPPDRPLLASLLRALPAGLALLAIRRALPPRGLRWKAAALGVLNIGIFMPLLFLSAYRLPGGVAATLGAIGPLIVAGLAWALLQERLLPMRVVAGVTGAGGVALLVLGASARLDAVGLAAGLLGTVSMALGTVLTRRWVRDHQPLDVTAWQLTAGGLALIPVTLVGEGLPGTVTVANVAGWAYLGVVGGALAYALWFRGLSRLPAAAAAFLPLLSPLVAALLGLAVLGQNLALRQWAGFVIALGSMVAGALVTSGKATKGQTDATDLDGDHRQHPAGEGGRPDRPLVGRPRAAVR
jgi:probable blue pigment (indigoidine) exporter